MITNGTGRALEDLSRSQSDPMTFVADDMRDRAANTQFPPGMKKVVSESDAKTSHGRRWLMLRTMERAERRSRKTKFALAFKLHLGVAA